MWPGKYVNDEATQTVPKVYASSHFAAPDAENANDCEQFRECEWDLELSLRSTSSRVHFTYSTLEANKQVIKRISTGHIDILRAGGPNEFYYKFHNDPRSGTTNTRANSIRCVLTQTVQCRCLRREGPVFCGSLKTRRARDSWIKTGLCMLHVERCKPGCSGRRRRRELRAEA